MKTILVPTDFSEAAENAVEYAVEFAKELNAKVFLFHVFHTPIPPVDAPIFVPVSEELQNEKEFFLQKKADQLTKNTGVNISYSAKMGMAVEEILDEEKNADMIIMGIRTVGKLSEHILGSISTAILRKATIPVIIVPEGAKFKAPKKIVFACDYDSRTNYKTIESLNELINVFKSKLLVINIKNKKELVTIEEASAGLRLEQKLSDIEHMYHF